MEMAAKPKMPPLQPNDEAKRAPKGAPMTDASAAIAPRIPMVRLKYFGGVTIAIAVNTPINAVL